MRQILVNTPEEKLQKSPYQKFTSLVNVQLKLNSKKVI